MLILLGLTVLGLTASANAKLVIESLAPLQYALIVVMFGSLAWRKTRPRTVVVVVAASTIALWVLTRVDSHTAIAGAIAIYGIGKLINRPQSLLWFGGVLGLLMMVTSGQVLFDPEVSSWLKASSRAVLIIGSFWFGDSQQSRDRLLASVQERAQRAEEHQQVIERQAILDERNRIARELHDVIAHSLSVIIVQANAAIRLAPVDRQRSTEAMGHVADVGRNTMDELRSLLGLLDDQSDQTDSGVSAIPAPQPSLGDLEDLVDRYRHAGLSVTLSPQVLPAENRLSSAQELTVIRIVQESLTNALRHAPGASVTVELALETDPLELRIDNGPSTAQTNEVASPAGDGRGLIGMKQRVLALGGELEAGPRSDGGFTVRATMPRLVSTEIVSGQP